MISSSPDLRGLDNELSTFWILGVDFYLYISFQFFIIQFFSFCLWEFSFFFCNHLD